MFDIEGIINKKIIGICQQMGLFDLELKVRKSKYRDYQIDSVIKYSYVRNKSPIELTKKIKKYIESDQYFENVIIANPGFICFDLSNKIIEMIINKYDFDINMGCKRIMVDFGGPNIAKDLHVGHLRSACLGISLSNLCKKFGFSVISDIHLGDFGYNIGLILAEIEKQKFDLIKMRNILSKNQQFLFRRYVEATERALNSSEFDKRARFISANLDNIQYKNKWRVIREISVMYLKELYNSLGISFDYWYGESDSLDKIPNILNKIKKEEKLHEIDGALMYVEKNESMKPVVLVKSDGSYLYTTTELSTILKREELFKPREIWYIVDKRQFLHFDQVFHITKEIFPDINIGNNFIGFGTINDRDGKPLKSRDGRSSNLNEMMKNLNKDIDIYMLNFNMDRKIIMNIAELNIKFRILSIKREKNIIYNYHSFLNMKGFSGFYIYNTMERLESILGDNSKYFEDIRVNHEDVREISLCILNYYSILIDVYNTKSFHKFCQYLFNLCKLFNKYYTVKYSITGVIDYKLVNLIYIIIKKSLEILNVEYIIT